MKKYLGIISFLYAFIIIYVIISNNLKNYLSPNMQIYLKVSVIPLILIGLVLFINNKVNYKFKISDLVLLLPILMIIISGDGKLSYSLANNRIVNINKNENKVIDVVQKDSNDVIKDANENEKLDNNEKESALVEESKYDFSNPYFDIVDSNYDDLSGYLTYSGKSDKYIGKTIKLRGFTIMDTSFLTSNTFAIGKYVINCCAADASFTGFIVRYDKTKIKNNTWYEIEGILESGVDGEGYKILQINAINIKEFDNKDEEQYVYPCYAYDDGMCSSVTKYNLEF